MTILDRSRLLEGASVKHAQRWLPAAALTIDLAASITIGLAAYTGRRMAAFLPEYNGGTTLGWPALLMLVGWVVSIAAVGGYQREIFGHGLTEFKRMTRATLLTAALVGIGCYLSKYDLSRGFFLVGFAAGFPMLIGGRLLLRMGLRHLRRRGHLLLRVLVAGTPDHVDEVVGVLRRRPELGYSVIGAVTPDPSVVETGTGVPVLGSTAGVVDIAQAAAADVILFAAGSTATGQELRERVWELEHHAIDVVIAPSVTDVSTERMRVRPVGGLPLIHVDRPTWGNATRAGKRTFDVLGSALIITMLSPVFLWAAARIWFFDRGPLLYRQQRVGRDGETFACLKFRTMVVDADALIPQLLAETGQSALLFKMKDDPRITKPGRWMRRYSVDELPQLFNVLRGDMSLVGPRPQVQREVDLYQGGMERRLLVRPGMTGLWQVSGRNDLTPAEAQRLDLFYVDNWSMLQDLSILLRTTRAIVGSHGAY